MITYLLLGVAAFLGFWAWKYYRLPSVPDNRNYHTIEERAESALAFAKSRHYIWKLVNSELKPLLLWNYCTKKR